MNELTRPKITAQEVNPISMIFDPVIADRVMAVAQTMAKGRVTVPEHLRNNIGDCLAIVIQAASWRLNPFAVAQKTHVIHGRLGYEAQLISAVVSSLELLDGRFSYEYVGDWRKVSKRPKGIETNAPKPGWTEKDEEGLSIVVQAKLKGDPDFKEHRLDLVSAWPRYSSLWATTPRQQIAYLATKQWVRLYAPDAILGVYTPDEIEKERIVEGERIDVPSDISSEIMSVARETENHILEWPKERNGIFYDVRNIPWDERIHSGAKSCTNDGLWRRRRGVSNEETARIENELTAEKEEPGKEKLGTEKLGTEEHDPPQFSEQWFNVMISESMSEDELQEVEAVLFDKDLNPSLHAEVMTGLDNKIAARRAELNASA